MKPERESTILLATTQARAKMHEYQVAEPYFNRIVRSPSQLFSLAIGMLGDVAAGVVAGPDVSGRLLETKDHLVFCARFFDSFFNSRLDGQMDSYMLLLASTTYYLARFPGSAAVVAALVPTPCQDIDAGGLEDLLAWVLKARFENGPALPVNTYGNAATVAAHLSAFTVSGTGAADLRTAVSDLRRSVYRSGTARELLLADLVGAVVLSRLENATWSVLPRYSGVDIQTWSPILQRTSFIRELWPAQHLLGESGLYRGISAVVQMPTSAGKTRAVDLIIRGAFYSQRTSLAIVVAPFRALCEEIRQSLTHAFADEEIYVDELSDVQQPDFDMETILSRQQVLVMTPEKCLYLMRHSPDTANGLGLLVYDEGHQFDSGRRGVTYELLITALKGAIPANAQTVLISAVLSNARAIADWLLGVGSVLVSGTDLLPTARSLAFASWRDELGRLEFTETTNPEQGEFFVPRLIERQILQLKPRERTQRVFPERDGGSIGLYLGMRVAASGAVAVFVGTKRGAASLARKSVEIYERGFTIPSPATHSDPEELRRLVYQSDANLGGDATATAAARLGIFSHHGNTPHGIRLAVEHAMKENLIRLVICTSTLAQGVNLPIRYLIITGAQQGRDRIKTRDFHNLLGRAGRAGIHTEGTVIFSDPQIYDTRAIWNQMWRWQRTKELLDPAQSEECRSALLSVFDPVFSPDRRLFIPVSLADIIAAHAAGRVGWLRLARRLARQYAAQGFLEQDLLDQCDDKEAVLSGIESFLMAHWDEESGDVQTSIGTLATSTLAFHLATPEQREQLVQLFESLAETISDAVPEAPIRRVFARSLFGLADSTAVRQWVDENIELLAAQAGTQALLQAIWPLFGRHVRNKLFTRCVPQAPLLTVAEQWTEGRPYNALLPLLSECRFGDQRPTIENVVELCENALGFEGMLVVGAVAEMVELLRPEETNCIELLRELQKEIKYGLPSGVSIGVFELGFADRVVAQQLATRIGGLGTRRRITERLAARQMVIRAALSNFPHYFTTVLDNILA